MADDPQQSELIVETAEPTYAEAVEELERILSRIEDAEIDVDSLSSAVERAAELLRLCRDRIGRAETQVLKVLSELDESNESQSGSDGSG